ncbi:hypothetical protein LMG24238_03819 [Paraburkholderia sediminicola]|uniref:Uncharacterized protein n=1 Tax=Paraburkholderia sediminicola TaxID=458836 RepID=A0A6J5BG71_9BURK|nr:hypothetical protein [Paraburkholderia sediminicola]CAB3704701.1 hypothetical protein LMG24238_03819 [Paraburkholderia sediminicola]
MHQIQQYQSSVTLFSRDGRVSVYPSLKTALKALGERWITDNVGADFRMFDRSTRWFDQVRNACVCEPRYLLRDFIMRDDADGVVTLASFHPYIVRRRRLRWQSPLNKWNGEGPVPGVRCHRGGRHYFRRPKSMMERRQAALVLKEEGEVPPRSARSFCNLPDAYDDYGVSSSGDRCWKRYRRTQWKTTRD